VKSLSGGERNRLLLARLFANPANALVLDEPTNDLDIDTLELLEELLENYTGTVFLVSHDRAFLDNVVTQVIVSEGEGRWSEFIGGFSDWERYAKSEHARAAAKPAAKAAPKGDAKAENKSKKLSYKEQRELEELPKQIAKLEAEQQIITVRLQDTNLYKTQPDEVSKLNRRYAEIDDLLLTTLEQWEAIEARNKE
jgi:ATP-binding cassette subfamily F protein uup